MKDLEKENRKFIITSLLVLSVIGVVLYFLFFAVHLEAWRFKPVLEDYINISYKPSEKSVKKGEVPYRTGKLLIVEKKKGQYRYIQNFREPPTARIDKSWYKLPGSVRARNTQELNTLVVIQYQRTGNESNSGEWKLGREIGDTGFASTKFIGKIKVFDMDNRFLIGEYEMDDLPLLHESEDMNKMHRRVRDFFKKMPLK
ncbi:MAG: hypothetical protein P9M03_02535 [Candidatus Theseobacter exili]|nr:hypothetical protein [Candidatus Theseobacter exili]